MDEFLVVACAKCGISFELLRTDIFIEIRPEFYLAKFFRCAVVVHVLSLSWIWTDSFGLVWLFVRFGFSHVLNMPPSNAETFSIQRNALPFTILHFLLLYCILLHCPSYGNWLVRIEYFAFIFVSERTVRSRTEINGIFAALETT